MNPIAILIRACDDVKCNLDIDDCTFDVVLEATWDAVTKGMMCCAIETFSLVAQLHVRNSLSIIMEGLLGV